MSYRTVYDYIILIFLFDMHMCVVKMEIKKPESKASLEDYVEFICKLASGIREARTKLDNLETLMNQAIAEFKDKLIKGEI